MLLATPILTVLYYCRDLSEYLANINRWMLLLVLDQKTEELARIELLVCVKLWMHLIFCSTRVQQLIGFIFYALKQRGLCVKETSLVDLCTKKIKNKGPIKYENLYTPTICNYVKPRVFSQKKKKVKPRVTSHMLTVLYSTVQLPQLQLATTSEISFSLKTTSEKSFGFITFMTSIFL